MKILRLLLFEDCNRNCEGCCNKEWDLGALEVETDFTGYDMVLLTGGEPMLRPNLVSHVIGSIRFQNPSAKIILYTAKTDDLANIVSISDIVDGLTVTLHEQSDVEPFVNFMKFLSGSHKKSLRLNIFEGIDTKGYNFLNWEIRDNKKWIKDSCLPENEVLKRYSKVSQNQEKIEL